MDTHPAPDLETGLAPRKKAPARARDLIDRMIARRLAGKVVQPVRDAHTDQVLPITYPYGALHPRYTLGRHTGEDHAAPIGSHAIATTWGVVEHAGDGSSWGAAYG